MLSFPKIFSFHPGSSIKLLSLRCHQSKGFFTICLKQTGVPTSFFNWMALELDVAVSVVYTLQYADSSVVTTKLLVLAFKLIV